MTLREGRTRAHFIPAKIALVAVTRKLIVLAYALRKADRLGRPRASERSTQLATQGGRYGKTCHEWSLPGLRRGILPRPPQPPVTTVRGLQPVASGPAGARRSAGHRVRLLERRKPAGRGLASAGRLAARCAPVRAGCCLACLVLNPCGGPRRLRRRVLSPRTRPSRFRMPNTPARLLDFD